MLTAAVEGRPVIYSNTGALAWGLTQTGDDYRNPGVWIDRSRRLDLVDPSLVVLVLRAQKLGMQLLILRRG